MSEVLLPVHDTSGDLDTDRRDSLAELDSINLTEVLDADARPTFIVDLDPDEGITIGAKRIVPIFCNAALRLHEKLYDAVLGRADPSGLTSDPDTEGDAVTVAYEDFSVWATGVTKFDSSRDVFPLSFEFRGMLWTGSTVRQRWRLVSGNLMVAVCPPSPKAESVTAESAVALPLRPEPVDASPSDIASTVVTTTTALLSANDVQSSRSSAPAPAPKASGANSESTGDSSQSARLHLAAPEKAVADWTVPNPKGILSAHVAFARTVKWEKTPLGPMESWSPEFRQTVNLVMGNPHPAALFWGAELTMLYNEAYANEVAGNKHPSLMGTGFSGPFSELWDAVSGIFAECARTGISIRKEDDYLPIERRGFIEETFYSWSWTPMYGGTSRILGFYNAPFETTHSVLRHRRMKTISQVGENVSRSKTMKQFWKALIDSLEDNHFDVPFALLYSVGEVEEGDEASVSSGSSLSLKCCHLEGALGVPEGHVAAPQQLDLKRSRDGFVPAFREAMRTREPTLLHVRDGSLPEDLLDGIQFRGFGDVCTQAVISPIRPTNGENVLAFLLVGINPRRPYDDEYKSFTAMLNRQLATSVASFMLYRDEVRKSRDLAEAAALEQEQLTQQLALQKDRHRRMTELSPLGMYLVSPEGVLREANDRYYEMTGHSREDFYEKSWMELIEDGSKATMEEGWNRMAVDKQPWSGELQMKKLSANPVDLHGEAIDYWLLVTALPEFAPDGTVRSIMGSITDISHLKWAQGLQARRLVEAEERRRQQNEFIDLTSHELRNPLSAILQCADDIQSTIKQVALPDTEDGLAQWPVEEVRNCLEAAQTITLCVQHQKSIVDDILTVSKLDSNLLVITPVATQPLDVVRRAIKMFAPELEAKQVEVKYEVHSSFEDLKIDYTMLDPSRILQILINLITNAIKFTAGAAKRTITVSAGVSRDKPLEVSIPGFKYIPPRTLNNKIALGDDWGNGDIVYLNFRVSDTGVGLTPEEMTVLFERFSQASPRTHAQYGGSGLGLFISRQLAELHGGQIGVASQASHGSTFGFFVMARMTSLDAAEPLLPFQQLDKKLAKRETLLSQAVAPQRQDLTLSRPMADLVAARSQPVQQFDPAQVDILVVEDNLINQKLLVKHFRKIGCTVSVANDGIEALAFLAKTHFCCAGGVKLSVILMDLEMPNMDGLTCVGEIRRMEAEGAITLHVPVIAVTANVRHEQLAAAKKAGMDMWMSKPFRIIDLLKMIQELLGFSRPKAA
ncbi:aerobic respiration control sensor protein arcB [Plectosphaerella plurivora]|uniref:histidine kinase n=1 Tax=Plectosphaerella plurivora TaxID=936078 RepID=A0A9P8V8H4_9PEZI|nr:aerobic respiration control sensor protein arcB [Plectosphaerella plurivora]